MCIRDRYVAAVQHLRRRKLAQWFLPVLYAPATARPLFTMPAVECDLRETLDTIVARWDSDQDVNAGLVVLEGRFKDENRAAGQRAEELCQAIRKLRDVETTFDQMVTEILERRPWSAVHEQWAGLPVAIEHDFHPEAVPLDTTVIGSFDVLRRTLERLERLAGVAVAALERLAAFEGGDVPALTDGCRRLQEVFCAEAENQPDFPRQVFEEGVVTLLAECEPAEEGAEPCPEALSIVAQVLHLLDESGEAFLAPAQAEALRGRAMALAARLAGQRAAPLLARIGEAIAHVGRTGSPLEQAESARTAAARGKVAPSSREASATPASSITATGITLSPAHSHSGDMPHRPIAQYSNTHSAGHFTHHTAYSQRRARRPPLGRSSARAARR